MQNTPNIRFKGFSDAWEQRKLSDIGEIVTGTTPPTKDKDNYGGDKLFVSPADIQGNRYVLSTTTTLTDKGYALGRELRGGSSLFVSIGSTIGKVAQIKDSATTNQQINAVIPYADMDDDFVFTMLENESDKIKKLSAQQAVPIINKTTFGDTEIKYPDKEEQVKIGLYFSNLDNLITLHQHKCDETKKLKKYMLQKMFPKNGERFPEIRFEGFSDAWEQRKLGEVCERVTRKNKNGESDLPLTIASQYGLIDQRDFFNKVVAAKDMSNYYLLKKGEFAYNKSYSNGFDYGSIKRLNAYEQGCLSTLYICFGITSDDVESDYLECYFDTLKWYGDVSQICAEGARNHGLLNVDTKAFFDEVTIEMPSSKEEQKKISAYLNNLDNLITLHQHKCDELKEIKKFMLQNMFPQG